MAHQYYLKKIRGLLFCLLLLAGFSVPTFAQFTITGTVTDAATGNPLVGVNIYHQASGNGTATNVDGKFTLKLPGQSATLRISYIGYVTQNVEVSATDNVLTVELESDVAQLGELVVTGLASSIRRKNLANAVSSVSAEELTGTTSPQTVTGALQGKIAGVQISSYSGAPGGGFNIQLRGISTLGAGSSQPLIIIDGIYMSNASPASGRSIITGASSVQEDNVANMLAGLNPEDIESIEVLKGPSAAAIYGQRANAGVVIITTKEGVAGETTVSINQDIGFNTAREFIGRANWNENRIIAQWDNADIPGLSDRAEVELERYRTAKANGTIRDVEKVFYGNEGLINNTQISIAGGDETTRFYISGNFEREEGIVETTFFKRRSIRANLDHDISESIHISTNSNYIHRDSDRGFTSNQNSTGGSIGYTIAYVPNYAYGLLQQNPDGTYPDNPYFLENPFRLQYEAVNDVNVDRFLQSISLQADLYTEGASLLSFSVQGGLDYFTNKAFIYFPNFMQSQKTSPLPGEAVYTTHESLNLNLQAILLFNTTVESGLGNFILESQAGVTRFDHQTELTRLHAQGFLPGQTNVNNASEVQTSQFFTDATDIGLFGQQTINWDNKLIGTIGARLDRSTLNLQQEEYYFYPKASLAIRLTNFEFWPTDAFDQFKLRVAYGETGGLPSFGSTFLTLDNSIIGENIGVLASESGVDPDLKPERAKGLEFGVDLAFFDNRLSFSATRYVKTVENLILGLEPSPATGMDQIITNAATLENKGIELSLNLIPVQTNNFSWNTQLLWWTNETIVTNLKIPAQFDDAGLYFAVIRYEEGTSPTTIYGRNPTDDVNGRVKLGNLQPDYQMSWSSQFTFWGNLEFSFLWDVSQGSELLNLSRLLTDSAGNTTGYWSNYPELPDRVALGGSTYRFMADGSFIKLRKVALYYTLPAELLNNIFGGAVSSIKAGVSGTNLLSIDNYLGYDPEVNTTGRSAVGAQLSITPYPPSTSYMFHIDLQF